MRVYVGEFLLRYCTDKNDLFYNEMTSSNKLRILTTFYLNLISTSIKPDKVFIKL